jgi:hypothetical protein
MSQRLTPTEDKLVGIGLLTLLSLVAACTIVWDDWRKWPPHKFGPTQFLGYECTELNCLGHRRGFLWALEKKLSAEDEYECEDVNSKAFSEGCTAYVTQQLWFAPFSQDEVIKAIRPTQD